jgi:two-component SAPR family response regulator
MDPEDIKELFEEKYQKALNLSFEQWQEQGPQNEAEAYARLQEIDDELNRTYDDWYEALGTEKEHMEKYRDKLKAEYDLIEEAFGLEAQDKNW